MNANRISRISNHSGQGASRGTTARFFQSLTNAIALYWSTPIGCEIFVQRMFAQQKSEDSEKQSMS